MVFGRLLIKRSDDEIQLTKTNEFIQISQDIQSYFQDMAQCPSKRKRHIYCANRKLTGI